MVFVWYYGVLWPHAEDKPVSVVGLYFFLQYQIVGPMCLVRETEYMWIVIEGGFGDWTS